VIGAGTFGTRGVKNPRRDARSANTELGIQEDGMEMDQMECVCGEILIGEKGKGELARQYAEHQLRPDHQITAGQWLEA